MHGQVGVIPDVPNAVRIADVRTVPLLHKLRRRDHIELGGHRGAGHSVRIEEVAELERVSHVEGVQPEGSIGEFGLSGYEVAPLNQCFRHFMIVADPGAEVSRGEVGGAEVDHCHEGHAGPDSELGQEVGI